MSSRPPVRGHGLAGPAAASIALHAVLIGAAAALAGWLGGGDSPRAVVIGVGAPQLQAPAVQVEPELGPIDCPPEPEEPEIRPVAEEFPTSLYEAIVIADEPPAWLKAPPRESRGRREAEKYAEEEGERGEQDPLPPRPPVVAAETVETPAAITQDTCPAPEYPRIARRRGEEGTVWLRLRISPEGLPTEVILERSSGHSVLDEAALAAARAWTLIPATRDGRPVEGILQVPVTFRLEVPR